MSAIEAISAEETATFLSCNPASPVSLYKMFLQVQADDKIDITIKRWIAELNKKIYSMFGKPTTEWLEEIAIDDLIELLKYSVSKMDCKQVQVILNTKRVPVDSPKLKEICITFTYSTTTDELAHEMLKLLIDYGFDWTYRNYGSYRYSTYNSFLKVIELLLDSGLDANQDLSDESSLLQFSAKRKRDEISKLLLERGALVSDAIKKKLPTHLQKLADECALAAASKSSKMCTDEAQVLTILTSAVNKITDNPAFMKEDVKIVGIYHRFVNTFVSQYNAENASFVVSFDSDAAVLTVQWK